MQIIVMAIFWKEESSFPFSLQFSGILIFTVYIFQFFPKQNTISRMLRRCMTPNPNQNKNMLSEIVEGCAAKRHKEGTRINYDSFIYRDGVTKKKVVLSDMKQNLEKLSSSDKKMQSGSERKKTLHSGSRDNKRNGSHVISKHRQLNQNREIDQINDCFMLMKTTKLFQMSSLKDKLFSKPSENSAEKGQNGSLDAMRKKKKQIREFIEDYVKNINIEEFRRYMEPSIGDRIKLINPNILNLGKYMSNVISKHNLEKIIEEFLLSENKEKMSKKPISISIDDISFPEEQRLKELLFHRVFMKNKDFEHLIFPSQSKQIYRSIHGQAQMKNTFACNFKYNSGVQIHRFQEFAEGEAGTQNQTALNSKLSGDTDKKFQEKKKEIVMAVQNGSTYDFLFLIIRWPKLLHFRDEKGNNILHIAAKTNQVEVYNIALKKMGMSALKQKNNFGRTPADVAKLFGSCDIVCRNKELGCS